MVLTYVWPIVTAFTFSASVSLTQFTAFKESLQRAGLYLLACGILVTGFACLSLAGQLVGSELLKDNCQFLGICSLLLAACIFFSAYLRHKIASLAFSLLSAFMAAYSCLLAIIIASGIISGDLNKATRESMGHVNLSRLKKEAVLACVQKVFAERQQDPSCNLVLGEAAQLPAKLLLLWMIILPCLFLWAAAMFWNRSKLRPEHRSVRVAFDCMDISMLALFVVSFLGGYGLMKALDDGDFLILSFSA